MQMTALEEKLIAYAETLISSAFPDADKQWISAAARWQILGERTGFSERERGSCTRLLHEMELAQGKAKAA
ncbi:MULTISPECIES: hypothetical protein [Xanthomonas translucens group]|uniref:hypothetical protein n=1 Tax=Xanthomonas translucens group TaxID=3390202 RepID=UPI0019D6EAE6|nr:hypothetical protein [Xanthomonas translucens]QSQ54798.1 hypothetical protein ISN36_19600 [Xanthomonas translucens pv. undulosa]WIH07051.1 hypothetical protein KHF85_20210 [Xanthomonas translucens pv. graminis]